MKARNIIAATLMTCAAATYAAEPINYDGSLTLGVSSGRFAPYYMASNRYGTLTQSDNALFEAGFVRPMDTSRRLGWSYGARAVAGATSTAPYEIYDAASLQPWSVRDERPAPVWLQELWGSIRYRSLELEIGMRQRGSVWLDNTLSSGDLIMSANARPIPQVRIGFNDFQDIPLTNHWVQIYGNLSYGKFTQNGWLKDHYNYYNRHITLGQLFCYREVMFRSNPDKPFSVTIGTQMAALFGGDTFRYDDGELTAVVHNAQDAKAFFDILIPTENNGDLFYEGQHLGSWDLMARYRFRSGHEVKAYFQWPWEDGSGMAKRNGWDGLWGLEYKSPGNWWIDGAVIEYLDMTNQSGPIHFAPQYNVGSGITTEATGADNYYNNYYYNAYMNYGMSIGTPMLMSPIYNSDGFLEFRHNRIRGVHAAVSGHILPSLSYRVMAGWRKAFGTPMLYVPEPLTSTMAMAEGVWTITGVPGLSLSAQLALDHGKLPGNSFGAIVSLKYEGSFNIGKKTSDR